MTARLLFHGTAAAAALILSFVLAVFAVPVAVQAANATVEIVKPADGAVLLWTFVQGDQKWFVEVAPKKTGNPPPCYVAVVEFRKPPGDWTIMTSINNPISKSYSMSFPISWFGDDALYRIKAAANEECKYYNMHDVDDWVWTDWNHYTIERKELTLAQAEDLRATTRKPTIPTLKAPTLQRDLSQPGSEPMTPRSGDAPPGFGTALTAPPTAMKTLPGASPSTPRSGDAPPGFGKAHPVPATKMTKVKLLPGNLVIDEFILKTDDPQPGHTVDVKVKVRNGGQGPTVKDEWKLVVKCYKSPGGDACEQQLGPVKLAAIPKGGVVWKTLPGAVKVNNFGSYKLQANVWGGSSAFSGYLDFKVNMPKADKKKMKQVPVDLPGPGPQVQETAPAPRKITPQRQQIQVR